MWLKKLTTFSLIFISITFFITCSIDDSSVKKDKYDSDAIIISDDISSPTTWQSGKVYVVTESINITSTLTIQAGTIIKFESQVYMETSGSGSINASAGTSTLPIVFTSIKDDIHGGDTNIDKTDSLPLKKDWSGIFVNTNGSLFNSCEFYYGSGTYDITLEIDSTSATISNCIFAYNEGTTGKGALNLTSAAAGTVLTGNRFYANLVPITANTTFSIDASNYFSNTENTVSNTCNGIFITGTEITGNIAWSETKVAYVITTTFDIDAGNTLTLSPGIKIKVLPDQYINVQGTLNASGNSTDHIVFTSYKDDTFAGDTNGDLVASTPQRNDWSGIFVTANGSSFNYCELYYSGKTYHIALDIDGASATISNCIFAYNEGTTGKGALNLTSAAAGTVLTGNRFYANLVPITANTTFSIDASNYFSNTENTVSNTCNGIFITGTEITGNIAWSETKVAYVITTTFDIDAGNTLTLANNVALKFQPAIYLNYDGANLINYNGTGVVFTSYKDDSIKGDTNGDNTLSSASSGDWDGIYDSNLGAYEAWSNMAYNKY